MGKWLSLLGFPYTNCKRNKGLEFPGVLPGSGKPSSAAGNGMPDIRLGDGRWLCWAPHARSACCSRSGVEMASA